MKPFKTFAQFINESNKLSKLSKVFESLDDEQANDIQANDGDLFSDEVGNTREDEVTDVTTEFIDFIKEIKTRMSSYANIAKAILEYITKNKEAFAKAYMAEYTKYRAARTEGSSINLNDFPIGVAIKPFLPYIEEDAMKIIKDNGNI